MIDSEAIKNYISIQFTHDYNVLTVKKAQPYTFTAINETNFSNNRSEIDTEILSLLIIIKKYYEKISFDIVKLAN